MGVVVQVDMKAVPGCGLTLELPRHSLVSLEGFSKFSFRGASDATQAAVFMISTHPSVKEITLKVLLQN